MKRVIIIVLDSVGIGELPDAAKYGDKGSNTLLNIKKAVPHLNLKNMNALGLSSITGAEALKCEPGVPVLGAYGRLAEASAGKDTTTGHWEIAGILTDKPFSVYLNGFPEKLVSEFEQRIERKVLGNCAASGTEIIDRLGGEHTATGYPILYTSADSVFQIAMHEDIIPIEEQYIISKIAREMLNDKDYNVSRVITRPFTGIQGNYKRTSNRRDFSLEPASATMLDYIKLSGKEVAAVGKIEDIFAGKGMTKSVHTINNMDGVDKTLEFMDNTNEGLIFTNLVDFDMLYGHRNDSIGYANALMDFDLRLPELMGKLRSGDILFITADHGCDPTTEGTDHTREYIPLLVYGECVKAGTNLNTRKTFSDIGKTVLDYLNIENDIYGESFVDMLMEH